MPFVDQRLDVSERRASHHEFTAANIDCAGPELHIKVFPFLALPAELQDRVSQFMLVRNGLVEIRRHRMHHEASDVLYEQNNYVFAHPLAFEHFCLKIGQHQVLLRDVQILRVHPPVGYRNLFSAVRQGWTPRLISFGGTLTTSIAFKFVFNILVPLFESSANEERDCKHGRDIRTLRRAVHVERLLQALDVKSYDDYPYWRDLFPLVTHRSAQ
ncbi:hypothetical protein LTR49_021837 [Elasticomyces elasticus]|nr:hypothetical protein LTR49_021837 [Elasticomyces elasticus]